MTTSVEAAGNDVDAEQRLECVVCAHELRAHDAISRRYCQATQAHALTRNCICPAEAAAPA